MARTKSNALTAKSTTFLGYEANLGLTAGKLRNNKRWVDIQSGRRV